MMIDHVNISKTSLQINFLFSGSGVVDRARPSRKLVVLSVNCFALNSDGNHCGNMSFGPNGSFRPESDTQRVVSVPTVVLAVWNYLSIYTLASFWLEF